MKKSHPKLGIELLLFKDKNFGDFNLLSCKHNLSQHIKKYSEDQCIISNEIYSKQPN